jgi:DNA-binding beta-propeller fold protein YncE
LGESTDNTPLISPVAPSIYVGSSAYGNRQIQGVIDELRISDKPRVTNSDTTFLVVVDSGNNRLQVFDYLGNFVSSFGGPGVENGQFSQPWGVAVDSDNHVIVADTGNSRLQVLRFDGANLVFLQSISGFSRPRGLAVDAADRIYVADAGNNRIKILSPDGVLVAEYDQPNDGYSGGFRQPSGVAIDRYGKIVVADTGNARVVSIITPFTAPPATLRFDPAGKTVYSCSNPFTVELGIREVFNLGGFEFTLDFNPSSLRVENITLDSFLGSTGRSTSTSGAVIDNLTGTATFGALSSGMQSGPSGSGSIAVITFSAINTGTTTLALQGVEVRDSIGTIISNSAEQGSITMLATLTGDMDCDCDVDIVDIMLVASRWNTRAGDARYDARYDGDQDGDIDIVDIMRVAAHWSEVCSSGAAAADVEKKPGFGAR